ncbi:MAG TPA: protein kinase, partial [Longimicrobium sp.]|nr:protein kinase [Longimicrobium sp.]
REAKAVAKLHHPNILEVFDFSAAEAQDAYLVTEYIRGETLRQFLTDHERAVEPPEVAAMIIHELASALAQAHAAGIIHRDLKPENVMVREDGVLKLMDFGIAKMVDRDERMTMTGALVGSPAHMAPEIIDGQEAGPPSDVFSLGTMLYLLATHQLPFSANNATATLRRILDGVYDDPRQLAPAVSDELAEILATSLARQPSTRYPDAGRLRDALGAYLAGLGITHVGEELAAFFASPKAYRKQLVPRLVEALLGQSERFCADKRPARAMSRLNQVLALDEGNARAQALLGQLNQAKQHERTSARRKRLGLVATGAAALGLLGAGIIRALPSRPRPELPVSTRPDPRPASLVSGESSDARAPEPGSKPAKTAEPTRVMPEKPEPAKPPKVVAAVTLPRPAAQAGVPVVIKVRPFGYIRLDDGPRSTEARAQHALSATPGRHQLTVSCDFCLDVEETIDVKPQGANEVMVAAQLKPSRLSFEVQPANALVRIGQEQRAARDSLSRPFAVPFPRGF